MSERQNNTHLSDCHALFKGSGDHFVTLRSTKDGSVQELNTDIVVLSLGVRVDHSLFESLKDRERVFEIGTAAVPGRIAEAIRSAHETAVKLA